MQLLEQHIIQKNHPHNQRIDFLCFAAKNLYNCARFHIRQTWNFGRKHQQKFASIPHPRFVQQLINQAKLVGMKDLILAL